MLTVPLKDFQEHSSPRRGSKPPLKKRAQDYHYLVAAEDMTDVLSEYERAKSEHLAEVRSADDEHERRADRRLSRNPMLSLVDDMRDDLRKIKMAEKGEGGGGEDGTLSFDESATVSFPPRREGEDDDDGSVASGALGGIRKRFVRLAVRRPSQRNGPKSGGGSAGKQSERKKKSSRRLRMRAKRAPRPPSIDDKFPNLRGSTQLSDSFDLYEYLGNSWGLVFMHPGDFTPVCTTELGRAASLEMDFLNRDVKMCGYSCDSAQTHWDWIKDIYVATGSYVRYPIYADPTRENAVKLGILDKEAADADGLPMPLRAVYILRPDRTIALTMTYPTTVGRNFDEILRCVDALQLAESRRVATPADWRHGDDVIVDFQITDKEADEDFGEGNWRAVELPSEEEAGGRDVERHYLRYTPDPSPSYG